MQQALLFSPSPVSIATKDEETLVFSAGEDVVVPSRLESNLEQATYDALENTGETSWDTAGWSASGLERYTDEDEGVPVGAMQRMELDGVEGPRVSMAPR